MAKVAVASCVPAHEVGSKANSMAHQGPRFRHTLPAFMRPLFSSVALGTLALCSLASAQTFAQFPFSLPWNDTTRTVISADDLNPAPLTNAQRISVKDGHFFDTTGRRVRFLGTNLVGTANF